MTHIFYFFLLKKNNNEKISRAKCENYAINVESKEIKKNNIK